MAKKRPTRSPGAAARFLRRYQGELSPQPPGAIAWPSDRRTQREPKLSPDEPRVDEALAIAHGLNADEFARFVALIGRTPTFTELGVVSAMWNEHCSYKSSRLHLKGLPTKAPWVIQGPGENAGVIDIGDGLACIFKMEIAQPPLLHRALSGRGDGGRRHPARRLHHGRAARRQPQLPALRRARPSQNPAAGRGRGGGDRRLRQCLRRADGRRLGRLRQPLRRQHPRQRDGRRRRPNGRDLLFRRDRRRQSDRLSRLQDRARRHPRRKHGLGRLRGRRRGEAPDGAGRRSVRRKAACSKPASNSWPQARSWRSRTWARRA